MGFADAPTRAGAWIVSLGKSVQNSDIAVRTDLHAVSLASRGAEFFNSVRALGTVSAERTEAFQRAAMLSRLESRAVLDFLVKENLVQLKVEPDGRVGLVVPPATTEQAYDVALGLFDEADPSDIASVAIAMLEATVDFPVRRDELLQQVAIMARVNEQTARLALSHLEVLGALQRSRDVTSGEPLIYNPLIFQFSGDAALNAIAGLDATEKADAVAIIQHVRDHPGVPLHSELRGRAYDVMKNTGVIDVSTFTPRPGVPSREFPTLQAAWGLKKMDDDSKAGADLIDDAKALLSSIRFGELFADPTGGRIFSPVVLLRALVRKGTVGPASNIGSDYPLIAKRGIVNIVQNPALPSRYSMELRKGDVVKPVVAMLDAYEDSVDESMESDSLDGRFSFSPPEASRRVQLADDLVQLRDAIIYESVRLRNV